MFKIFGRSLSLVPVLIPLLLLSGCRRSGQDLWDDTKSCGRHMARAFRSLGGTQCDSRQVQSPDEFMPRESGWQRGSRAHLEEQCSEEFSLSENPLSPPVGAFQEVSSKESWRTVFSNISFPYNSDLIKGSENSATLKKIAKYLKEHPESHLLIEGHCDERGAEAYNLSLGLRRAHAVRSAILQEGIAADRFQVISFGKERPIDRGHDESAWSKNRRAEFKLYEK